MIVCRTIAEMHAACLSLRHPGTGAPRTIGLAPTMGALHAGHLSLVHAARAACDVVAVSIFVNPTQFGPGEDFETYPRTFDQDCRKLEAAGADVLFAPTAEEMFPPGNSTFIDPGPIATRLDGASRPGHFRGVATIVTRLFHIIAPDRAYFGQKDAAQLAVIRSTIRDLNLAVKIEPCPTVREPDGLAMSSRNVYLSRAERHAALVLPRALRAACDYAATGCDRPAPIQASMLRVFATQPEACLDYAAIVDPDTLLPLEDASRGALIAVAAWIGKTRLIDNMLLPPKTFSGVALSNAPGAAGR